MVVVTKVTCGGEEVEVIGIWVVCGSEVSVVVGIGTVGLKRLRDYSFVRNNQV